VLWLIKGLGPGGAERLLTFSARLRDRRRVQGHVAYLLPHKVALVPAMEDEGVAVTCLGARHWWDPRWLLRLRRLLASEAFDVVHAHSPLVAAGARLVVRAHPAAGRPRMVTTEHSLWEGHVGLARWVNQATGRLDDARFAVSEAVLASMPPAQRQATEVLLHGVDVPSLRAQGSREAVRRELGLGEAVVIGTVANLRPHKGYPDLLAAARLVLDRVPDVVFVAVGQGPQEQEIRARHRELGLGDRFRLLGFRDDAVRVMSAYDVFCLASVHEGLPVATMEALALGLPVVATDVGGIPEVLTDGEEAVLVPAGAPERLADALVRVATDAGLRASMAAKATARADGLSVERAVRRVEEVYEAVVTA
jgi:glycosyltransferase involved in cell wall biosynthesis